MWDPDPLIAEWSIDAHPFRDHDGAWWLFYSARNDATRYGDGTIGCGIAVDRLLDPELASPVSPPSFSPPITGGRAIGEPPGSGTRGLR